MIFCIEKRAMSLEFCVRYPGAVMLQLALQNIMENMKSLCWIKKMVYWIWRKELLLNHQMDFRLEADFCNMKDEARCYYRVNKGDWLPIGTVHKLYFKLDHFTGCRFGLFCYAAEETGGSACFRDFKYYDVDEIS